MNGWWSGSLRCVALSLIALGLFAIPTIAQDGRKLLIHPQPVYPDLAKELSLKGNVRLEIVIGSDGEIKSTKPLGGHPILVQAATEAVKKWKYAPASGETTTTLEFSFRP
ncbi:MAG TPA: energy transducer TonB [Candidatus Acidoferrum sp.]|jgi:TonB family protein